MTQSIFNSTYGRLTMAQPFAMGDGASLTPIEDSAGQTNAVNFADGFPSVYGLPKSGGGSYVTRGQMNAIGNLASRNCFYDMCGGLNQFDIAFAHKIGGYPQGAILDYRVGNALHKIISLRDDNKVNPAGVAGTGSYADIIAGTVDDVYWRYMNIDTAGVDDEVFVGSYSRTAINTTTDTTTPNIFRLLDYFEIISGFTAPRSGILSAKNINYIFASSTTQTYSYSADLTAQFIKGNGIMYKDLGTSSSSLESILKPTYNNTNGWKRLAGFGTLIEGIHGVSNITAGNSTVDWTLESSIPLVEQGHYIAIGVMFGVNYFNLGGGRQIQYTTTRVGSGETSSGPLSFDLYLR